MSDPNTQFLINSDGGGVRGYASNEFLSLFFARWGVNQNEIWKRASIMGGASMGGIEVAALAAGYSPADIRPFFTEQAKRLFTIRRIPVGCNADSDSNTPNLAQKAALIAINDPFYKSPCAPDAGNSNFGDNILQTALVDKFGDSLMSSLKCPVVIPAVRDNLKQFVMFSNYENPFYEGSNEKIRDVLRATSAAPCYLPNYSFGGNRYVDGGLFANRMALEIYNAAKMKNPLTNRFCILSAGTGKGQYNFDPSEPPANDVESVTTSLTSLFGQTMDGQIESVDRIMRMKASPYTLDQVYYLNLNIDFPPNVNKALDNTAEDFLAYMLNLVQTTFNNNLANIDEFISRLNT